MADNTRKRAMMRMGYDPARRWGCAGVCLLCALAIASAIWLAAALCGCSPTRYIPVERAHMEYHDHDVERLVADTVRDTRVVWIKGDTMVDVRKEERIRRVEIHDTCYVERTYTIREPYPVERKLTRWEQTKMDFGGMALGAIAVALGAAVGWLVKKFRR